MTQHHTMKLKGRNKDISVVVLVDSEAPETISSQ